MTLQDIRDKYQQIANDESLLINNSPFRGHMNRSNDERYYRYQAMSNALYVFERYSRKSSILKWLREQLTTYQNNTGKPNAISAKAIADATKQTIQDAVWFHHIDQMSTREVAERYGCSVSIARKILLNIVKGQSEDKRFQIDAERGEGVIISDGSTFNYSPMDLNEHAITTNAPKHYIWFCD